MSSKDVFEKEYRDRASWKVFFSRFIENTSKTETYEEAYELTEKQHRSVYKRNCYSGYNSFRNVKSRKIKSHNKHM